jgi:hypothetical protein
MANQINELQADVWDLHAKGNWVGITTNGAVKSNGALVMGRGVALQAADRFPWLPFRLGEWVKEKGNVPCFLPDYKMFSFPVKAHWQLKADIRLIKGSLERVCDRFTPKDWQTELEPLPVYLPRPGCGNGGLDWEKDVKPNLSNEALSNIVFVWR